jgi:hypothetical protein
MRKVPRAVWKDPNNRIEAIQWLVEVTGKDPQRLNKRDMRTHHLGSLCRFEIPQLLKEAGYPVPRPFQTNRKDQWKDKEERVRAVRWLAQTTNKKGIELTMADYASNGLWTLWGFYHPNSCKGVPKGELLDYGKGWLLEYKNPALRAAAEAGLLARSDEKRARTRYAPTKFGTREARAALVRKAVERTDKRLESLSLKDLKRCGLTHLMLRYYDNDVVKALQDAGYTPDLEAVRPARKRGVWKDPKNRAQAVRRFVLSSGKKPEELTAVMMCKAGLGSLLCYASFWELLQEAGFPVDPWVLDRVPGGFWKERSNRGHAVRWLVDRVGLGPAKLGPRHFEDNCLFGLWQFMKKRIRSELGRTPYSKLTLARLLEDAGLMLPARTVMLRKKQFVYYGDDPRASRQNENRTKKPR